MLYVPTSMWPMAVRVLIGCFERIWTVICGKVLDGQEDVLRLVSNQRVTLIGATCDA